MYQISDKERKDLQDIITSEDELYDHLQVALGLEIAVIPPYLLGYYSLHDKNSPAARILLGVVMEEMLHIALDANLINAIGRKVVIDRHEVPHHYPCAIPYHAPCADGSPCTIHLQPVSREVARDLYMLIEKPSPYVLGGPSQPQGNHWDTLGQFYEAIIEGFRTVAAVNPDLFSGDPRRQYAPATIYNGGGRLYPAHDLDDAVRAIRENQQQTQGRRGNPYEPHGPLGAEELGHYFRFRQIADGSIPLGEVYPVKKDLCLDDMQGVTREIAVLFNEAYTLLLKSLEGMFSDIADYSRFNGVSRTLMNFVLGPLAGLLVRTPLGAGVHAGPTFDFDLQYPDIIRQGRLAYIDRMIARAEAICHHLEGDEPAQRELRRVLACLRIVRNNIAGRFNWDSVAGHIDSEQTPAAGSSRCPLG